MKVAYVVSGFPKLSESFVLNEITGLLDRGHDVRVLSYTRPTDAKVHEAVARYGLPARTRYMDYPGPGAVFAPEAIEAVVPCLDADVLHAHFAGTAADIARELSERVGIPYLVTAHAYDIFLHPDPERLRARLSGAAKVLTVSRYNRDYLVDLLGPELADRIEVRYLGVDLDRFAPADRAGRNEVTVLFVGRLAEKKGITPAVQAFARVAAAHPEARLRIVGDGPLRSRVVSQVLALGLGGVATLAGGLTQAEIQAELRAADLFLLPSRTTADGDREGLPVVLMEAQAAGLPVVSTIHAGIPEAVADGTSGFLVPENDWKALADRLAQLVADPRLRREMGAAARRLAEERFDLSASLDRLEAALAAAAGPAPDVGRRVTAYLPALLARSEQALRDGLAAAAAERARRRNPAGRLRRLAVSAIRAATPVLAPLGPVLRAVIRRVGPRQLVRYGRRARQALFLARHDRYPFHLPPLQGVGNDYAQLYSRVGAAPPDLPLSVVVPVYNRKEILAKTLAAFTHQTYPRDRFEVIVADDGSDDGVETVVERFRDRLDIRHVRQEHNGYGLSRVRNLGMRTARHDWVVLLDCDMLPVPGFLEAYARHAACSDRGVLIGHRRFVDSDGVSAEAILGDITAATSLPDVAIQNDVINPEGRPCPTLDWRLAVYRQTDFLRRGPRPFTSFCGGNVAFHRAPAEAAGMFDESFVKWGCEDTEFAYRLYNLGLYFVPVLDAEALHQEHPVSTDVGSRRRQYAETLAIRTQKVPLLRPPDARGPFEVPKVSIYIPCYNAERYIAECVGSALEQTFTDLEVCICDDGSTDGTLSVLEARFGDDPRVRWVSIPHGGIGKASNAAVRLCRGPYIGQLDADDRLLPDAVATLLAVLEADPAVGCAYGTYEKIDSDGNRIGPGYNWPVFSREKLLNNMIVHHFRMFRARDWNRTSGFDETLLNSVDYDMYLKLSAVCRFRHVNRVLYQRRLHGANTSVVNEGAQTDNTYRIVNRVLGEYGLDRHWAIDPDPANPRNVRFRPVSAASPEGARHG